MSSEPEARESELLFDLPLRGDGAAPSPGRTRGRGKGRDEAPRLPPENANLGLFEEEAVGAVDIPEVDGAAGADGPAVVPSVGDRLVAGLADLAVQVLALGAGLLGAIWMGVPAGGSSWPAFAGLGLSFSFLYWVVPLAFWGRTPGMAWLGHVARSSDDRPLTFGQAGRRWLGAVATLALAGLPQLLAFGGRTLTDRLSSSRVILDPG